MIFAQDHGYSTSKFSISEMALRTASCRRRFSKNWFRETRLEVLALSV